VDVTTTSRAQPSHLVIKLECVSKLEKRSVVVVVISAPAVSEALLAEFESCE